MDRLFNDYVQLIKKEYTTNSNLSKEGIGWRFLYGPKKTLQCSNGIMLIGLNPGGSEKSEDIPSKEDGNAYLTETHWQGGLKEQVLSLFQQIAEAIGTVDWKKLLNETLTSNFIPFSSQDFKKLPDKKKCIDFSKGLWQDIIQHVHPKVIICIGNGDKASSYFYLLHIFDGRGWSCKQDSFDINWGKWKVKYARLNKGNEKILIIGLPHLSYFSFIGREKSAQANSNLVKLIAEQLS